MRKFTIVIPTKNRCETLKWTLKSCLDIDYANYVIIVSDNCSTDQTAEVVAEFNDPKIIYYRTSEKLGMAANWEFGLSKVQDGMVTILGDDDAFMPDSLKRIDNLLNENKLDAISWKQSFYRWPNNEFVRIKNLLSIPRTNEIKIRDCASMLQAVLNLEYYPADLPWLYAGFVDIKYVQRVKAKCNDTFFFSKIPDLYSSMVLASVIDKYIYSQLPLSIAGHSATSNGAAQIQIKEEYSDQNKKFIIESESHPFHPSLEFVHVYPILVWETFLQAREQGVMRGGIILNKQFLLDRAITDCIQLDFIKRDLPMLESIARRHHLNMSVPNNNLFISIRRIWGNLKNYLNIWTNNLFISCSDYNIFNVYEASKNYRKLEERSQSRIAILFNNFKVLFTNL
ncbi:MAG: glycosyltransferase family A protein [Saprospiraceae bacterium]